MSNSLNDLILWIKNPDIKDDDLFILTLRNFEFISSLTDKNIKEKFSISYPTINNWKLGKNLPHELIRKHIYKYVEQNLIVSE